MNYFVFSLIALPLLAAIGIIYFKMKRQGLWHWDILAKCGGTYITAACAGVGIWLGGENPLTHLVFWFTVLCMLADGLLEIHFISGMLVFGIAHVLLIIWMAPLLTGHWLTLIIWTACMALMFLLFKKYLQPLKSMAIPYTIYAGILSATFAIGISLAFQQGGPMLLLGIGAAFFYSSDLLVAQGHFADTTNSQQYYVMISYWGALYLMASSMWFAV